MAKKFATSIDLRKHKVLNALLNPLTSTEIAALSLGLSDDGYVAWNVTTNKFQIWDGSAWVIMDILWQASGKNHTLILANGYIEISTDETCAVKGVSSKILGYGGRFEDALGIGVEGKGLLGADLEGSVVGAQTNTKTTGTNDLQPLINMKRSTSGTAAAGYGAYLPVYLQNSAGSLYEAFRMVVKETDPLAGQISTQIDFYGWRAGTWEVWMSILQSGKVRYYNYGGGSLTGTTTYVLTVSSDGTMIEVHPLWLQNVWFGAEITGSAEYIGKANRYNRSTECNRSTAQQLVIKINEFLLGEWVELYQKGAGMLYVLKETIEITGASTPSGVNCRYHVTGQENGKDLYYNGVTGYRIYWDTDRWKIALTVGGTLQFERVNASPLGAYSAVNGTGSPTAADVSSQMIFEGETETDQQYSKLRVICTDATNNANKFRIEYYKNSHDVVEVENTGKYSVQSAPSMSASAWTQLIFDTEHDDETTQGFTNNSGNIEADIEAVCFVTGMVVFKTVKTSDIVLGLRLTKNGDEIPGAISIDYRDVKDGYITMMVSTTVYLDSGSDDYVTMEYYTSDAGNISIDASDSISANTGIHAVLTIHEIK